MCVGAAGLSLERLAVPRIPSLPRLPGLPDPLRRVHVPRDLESVTAIGQEGEASAGGMSGEPVERIWGAAVDLYRSGVHPAVQVCVRREGAVGARPRDRPHPRQRPP